VLPPEGPVIELQCLPDRTANQSFSLNFEGWVADRTFVLVLQKDMTHSSGAGQASQVFPVLFERTVEGLWQVSSTDNLSTQRGACRQLRTPLR
jgi:hypothetical protein